MFGQKVALVLFADHWFAKLFNRFNGHYDYNRIQGQCNKNHEQFGESCL